MTPDRIAEIEKRAQAAKSSNSWKTLREDIPYLLQALAASQARVKELEAAGYLDGLAYDSGLEAAAKILAELSVEEHADAEKWRRDGMPATGQVSKWHADALERGASIVRAAKKGTP